MFSPGLMIVDIVLFSCGPHKQLLTSPRGMIISSAWKTPQVLSISIGSPFTRVFWSSLHFSLGQLFSKLFLPRIMHSFIHFDRENPERKKRTCISGWVPVLISSSFTMKWFWIYSNIPARNDIVSQCAGFARKSLHTSWQECP